MSSETIQSTGRISYFVGNPKNVVHRGTLRVCNASQYICIENIPKFITPTEFLGHVNTFLKDILSMRILGCPANTAQYFILLKMTDPASADELRRKHNGKPLSALGNEVLFIHRIEEESIAVEEEGCEAIPLETLHSNAGDKCSICLEEYSGNNNSNNNNNSNCLPHCNSSLERLPSSPRSFTLSEPDDVFQPNNNTTWTTMCGHTAHLQCLRQWDHTMGCHVCRFNPQDLGMECSFPGCHELDPLWMCLICGSLGCGRYQKAHAEYHYNNTSHTYCLHVYNGTVWDYAGDGFVHRLVADRSDKVFETSPGNVEAQLASLTDAYSQLLEEQLDAQRNHYDKQIEYEKARHKELTSKMVQRQDDLRADIASKKWDSTQIVKEASKLKKKLTDQKQQLAAITEELELEERLNKQIEDGIPKYEAQCSKMSEPSPAQSEKEKQLARLQAKVEELMKQLG
eukprot:TRINITY_DN17768_c0_g1_i2.p1 TRINITY_DN17768_c0_g1~~TRINITY_DN17768_c0_g1_i2.p1  ORF type:complete len:456 (+),score=105.72 TRINITY_DN17768_c0_g1_i2:71-1438(+)